MKSQDRSNMISIYISSRKKTIVFRVAMEAYEVFL